MLEVAFRSNNRQRDRAAISGSISKERLVQPQYIPEHGGNSGSAGRTDVGFYIASRFLMVYEQRGVCTDGKILMSHGGGLL